MVLRGGVGWGSQGSSESYGCGHGIGLHSGLES